MIPLKNPTDKSMIFPCKCAICKDEGGNPYEFAIVVPGGTTGIASCPNCNSFNIYVTYPKDKGDLLYT